MSEIKLIYQQVKDFIANDAKGKKPGEYLSSEVEYSKLFNVSRPTIRKAVNELIDSNTICRIPGKGLIVADPEKDNKTKKLLILINFEPDGVFFYKAVMGCINAANSLGYSYVIHNSSSNSERLKFIKESSLSDYSAVIINAYENDYDYEALDLFKKSKLPFVLIDNIIGDKNYPHIVTDDFKGGYLQGEYLINKGHRKIIYLLEDTYRNYTVKTRLAGFKKALSDHGISITDDYILIIKDNDEIKGILQSLQIDYTAICGYSDLPIVHAFNALSEMGVDIPAQVSLFGYGNYKYAEILKVPLTTINMPMYEMGYSAVNMAINKIKNKCIKHTNLLDVEIVERSSVFNLAP